MNNTIRPMLRHILLEWLGLINGKAYSLQEEWSVTRTIHTWSISNSLSVTNERIPSVVAIFNTEFHSFYLLYDQLSGLERDCPC